MKHPTTLIFKFHIIIIWFISLISFHYSLTFVFDFHFLKFHPCLSSLTGCHPWFSFLTFILKLVLHYSSTFIFDSLTFILNIYFLFLIAFILQTINPCSEQPTGPLIINKLLYLINLNPLIPLSDCNLTTNNQKKPNIWKFPYVGWVRWLVNKLENHLPINKSK